MIRLTKDRPDLAVWIDGREREFMTLAYRQFTCKHRLGKHKMLVQLNSTINSTVSKLISLIF